MQKLCLSLFLQVFILSLFAQEANWEKVIIDARRTLGQTTARCALGGWPLAGYTARLQVDTRPLAEVLNFNPIIFWLT
jgi:hypothetical protein